MIHQMINVMPALLTLMNGLAIAGTEPEPFQLESEQARAEVKRAEASLESARNNVAAAERAWTRAQILAKDRLPVSDWDAVSAAYEMAKVNLAHAKASVARAKAALRRTSTE
jgi:multidrug resistance efflux pump